jgi:hypothetical protein
MRKLILSATLFAALIFVGNTVKAQVNWGSDTYVDPNAAIMSFEHDTIDYGTIPHNADGYRYFKFTNTGKEPLIISTAQGSCGCTVPTWPHEPIMPGQQNVIKVHYATDRVGRVSKSVTIKSNANPGQKTIYIMVNVLADDPSTTKPNTPPNTPSPTPVPQKTGGK